MILRIRHATTYDYDQPVTHALQQLRLTPLSAPRQEVRAWDIAITGGRRQLGYLDSHGNQVELISFDPGTTRLDLVVTGEVALRQTHGVIGPHEGFVPLWLYRRATALTAAGPAVQALAAEVAAGGGGELALLHRLMETIADRMAYVPGSTGTATTAESALSAGRGVCQDMAHVMIAAARHLQMPARYVSGYLLMEDRPEQEATHGWAEVHVTDLGWVGFDPANRISPDLAHVRVASGLDYAEAAPISGLRQGRGAERMEVRLTVAEAQ